MTRTCHGSCRCGAVRFATGIDLAACTGRCNCSICSKARRWGAIVRPEAFRLLDGEAALADDQFGSHGMHYRFCRQCGIQPFGSGHQEQLGGDLVSVNLACLDDATPQELADAPVRHFDGRHDNSMNPPAVTRYL